MRADAHFGTNAPPAILIARALRVPAVVTDDGVDITSAPCNDGQRKRRLATFAAAARVLAVSTFIAQTAGDAGCPPTKVVVHYIGVDTAYFSPGDHPRAHSRVSVVAGIVLETLDDDVCAAGQGA